MRTTRSWAGWGCAGFGLFGLVASIRCANVDRGLGQPCERNEDCLSGFCAGEVCIAQPPVLTSEPDATVGVDAGQDAATDAPNPVVDAGVDAPPDASPDAPSDAPHDAADAGAHDGGHAHDSGTAKDAAKHD